MAEDAINRAKQIIAQFKGRGAQPTRSNINCAKDGIWLHVCRNRVADGLEARVVNPNLIAQTKTNMCGIAAFVRQWAEDDPAGYAWLGITLYENGTGRIGRGNLTGKEVFPSRDLKSSPIPQWQTDGVWHEMNHADWVILGSIREAFNGLFTRYTANDPLEPLAGMTLPTEVVNAFKAAGYTSIINQTDWAIGKGFDTIQEASDLVDAKWKVVLLINSNLLRTRTIDTQGAVGDHWVGLLSTIQMNLVGKDYNVNPFQIFTWGGTMYVPERNVPFPLTTLLKHYYGYVAAKY
ncbi:MAG TPA: hypothetical protein VKA70_05120 [Blastocatellia bacterium]|nr:hypothetical protein [Blastocatellia bacterium]